MSDIGVCRTCGREFNLTPGGKVRTHDAPAREGASGVYRVPSCLGSLKSPLREPPGKASSGSPAAPENPETAPSTGSPPTPPSQEELFTSKPPRATPRKRPPLAGEALAVSEWFDETFFAYQHSRPRSLQATVGPSEAGSACVRRIAMKLCQRPEVNLEKDSWPAWMGTQGHTGLEGMLRWANERYAVPRFLVEAALEFRSNNVPRGHSDAFDRRAGRVIDWKFPGRSALGKMHLDGCPPDYRDQGHIYGLGYEYAGETVREIAVIALPREGGSLADKYVFVEPYDRERGKAAIARVEGVFARLQGVGMDWRAAPKTPSYLCPFCPFYLPGDKEERKGCCG